MNPAHLHLLLNHLPVDTHKGRAESEGEHE